MDYTPKYAQVIQAIRARIESGEYPPGSKLPSETELVAEWGVSRSTIVRALQTLALTGWIVREHGRGSFVKRDSVDAVLGIDPDDPAQQVAARDVAACAALVGALVERRRNLGLTRGEVAERMGVPVSVVDDVESIAADPPLSVVYRYARVVGARLDIR